MQKNNSALFFTCSLIEYIARVTKNKRAAVVDYLGGDDVKRIYNYADVFHCEPIEKVADDFIEKDRIPTGEYDNVAKCRYEVPDYWTIGDVFSRLIEDSYEEEEVINGIIEVYHSWITDLIMNFNSDLYYQSREYLAVCYREGEILD